MNNIEKAQNLIKDAKRIALLTGAGVSAESGVPTFRDALTGLWERYDPAQLATAEAFESDRDLVWGWYEWRRKMVLEVQPNPAHYAIAQLEKRVAELILITQNVDDLHERAGSKNVLHLHGSLFTPRCFSCAAPYTFTAPPSIKEEQRLAPPKCAQCGGDIRPGVVWFGESMPELETKTAFEAAHQCDLFLSVGTSGIVYPAAGLPNTAAENGAAVIHLNPTPMPLTNRNEIQLVGKAGEILPQLVG